MFFRLLFESFRRQRRRKLLAGIAILFGTTAVTAMLAVATTIGDRIQRELTVYGANIVVYPQADLLDVKVGGMNLKPATGGAYLHESDLAKLHGIFWANNITGVSPELAVTLHRVLSSFADGGFASSSVAQDTEISALGLWFDHPFASPSEGTANRGFTTGAPVLHPWWKLTGTWPTSSTQVVIGRMLAEKLHLHAGDTLSVQLPGFLKEAAANTSLSPPRHDVRSMTVTGIVSTGDSIEMQALLTLAAAQELSGTPDSVSRVEVAARTKPEDAFARSDPDKLSSAKREIWYCRPYANSIAYQIQEAIPGSHAEQIRRVEQSEGNILSRISGLMWLISGAALLAAGFAVSAAMATTILERRGEIGLMRSLGASRGTIALLFYSETGILAVLSGAIGYLIGSGLAAWLGARIFAPDAASFGLFASSATVLNPVLLPVVIGLALLVSIAGSTPAIRNALAMDPSSILRADA